MNYFKIALTLVLFSSSSFLSYFIILKRKKVSYKKIAIFSLISVVAMLNLDLYYLDIVFISVLNINFLTDMHTGEVYNFPLYLLVFISFIRFYENPSYISLIFMIFIYIYKKTPKMQFYFGEGDLWILLSLSMMYRSLVFYILFYSSLIALLYALVLKRKEVYFIPFIYIGLFISKLEVFNKFLFIRF